MLELLLLLLLRQQSVVPVAAVARTLETAGGLNEAPPCRTHDDANEYIKNDAAGAILGRNMARICG